MFSSVRKEVTAEQGEGKLISSTSAGVLYSLGKRSNSGKIFVRE